MEQYDYMDYNLLQRILLRSEVTKLNKKLKGIFSAANFDPEYGYGTVMEHFFPNYINEIGKDNLKNVSAADYFGYETLEYYITYLQNIVDTWNNKNHMPNQFSSLDHVIEHCGKEIVALYTKSNCQPKDNLQKRLPKINGDLLRKANKNLNELQNVLKDGMDPMYPFKLNQLHTPQSLVTRMANYKQTKEHISLVQQDLFDTTPAPQPKNETLNNAATYVAKKSKQLQELHSKYNTLKETLPSINQNPAMEAYQQAQEEMAAQGYTYDEIMQDDQIFEAKAQAEEQESKYLELEQLKSEIESLDESITNYMKRNKVTEQDLSDYVKAR